jgi:hypothetical protein
LLPFGSDREACLHGPVQTGMVRPAPPSKKISPLKLAAAAGMADDRLTTIAGFPGRDRILAPVAPRRLNEWCG